MPVVAERSTTTTVVAVVLNWNAWKDTIACVESVMRSERAPDHILICDNGSVDASVQRIVEWAQRNGPYALLDSSGAHDAETGVPIVILPMGENLGYAGGNNVGIEYALDVLHADFIWILNSDVIVERSALRNMLDFASTDSSIGILGPKLLRFDQPDTIQALGGGHIIPMLCHDTQLANGCKSETATSGTIDLDHLIGASLLVRAGAVRSVGPIDESYFLYREETDWCIRMRRKGWRLVCRPDAVVWHKQSHSIGFKSPLHDYYAVRNMLYLIRKFYPVQLPTAFFYFACRSILPKLLRFEFDRFSAVVSAFGDFLTGVNGRSSRHSDAALIGNYIEGSTPQRTWRRPAFDTAAFSRWSRGVGPTSESP